MKRPSHEILVKGLMATALVIGPVATMTACGSSESLPGLTTSQGDQYETYRRAANQGDLCLTYSVRDVIGYAGSKEVDPQTLNWNAVALAGLRVDRAKWTGSQTAANDNVKQIIMSQNASAKEIGAGLAANYNAPRPEDIITIGLDYTNPDRINKGGNIFAIPQGTIGVVPNSGQEIPKWAEYGVHSIDCNTRKPIDQTLPEANIPIISPLPGKHLGE